MCQIFQISALQSSELLDFFAGFATFITFFWRQRRVLLFRIHSTYSIKSFAWARFTWNYFKIVLYCLNDSHQHSLIWLFFPQGKSLLIDVISGGDINRPRPFNTRWSEVSLSLFSARRALYRPYPRAFCTLPSQIIFLVIVQTQDLINDVCHLPAGHFCKLHDSWWLALPWQGFPPCAGAGLLHALDLVLTP